MKITEIQNGIMLENVENFDAEHVFECGQCFRWNREMDGSYTGVAFEKVINIRSDYEKGIVIINNTNIKDFYEIWYSYFDFDRDYGKIKNELSKDSVLEMAIDFGRGIRILNQEPWEMLISFIISANNNIPRISKSINTLSEMYGKPILYKNKQFYTFPCAEELARATLEELERCRAGFRCKYIFHAIKLIHTGEINLKSIKEMDIDDARTELMRISGVGPKVADCIMLFSMGKHMAYPVDVWVKRVTEHFYLGRDVKMKEIQAFAREKFGELAGFAQQYLFYYARNMKIM